MRNLIAWSHLSDPKTTWEHVRWQDFLRDANGAVPVKHGNAWAADQAPDEEKTRAQALNILKGTIGTDTKRPNDPNSAMVAPGYEGCAGPCKCGGRRTNHVDGAARDLGKKEMENLRSILIASKVGTLDDYLDSYGLYRPMKSEPWHVEAKKP